MIRFQITTMPEINLGSMIYLVNNLSYSLSVSLCVVTTCFWSDVLKWRKGQAGRIETDPVVEKITRRAKAIGLLTTEKKRRTNKDAPLSAPPAKKRRRNVAKL